MFLVKTLYPHSASLNSGVMMGTDKINAEGRQSTVDIYITHPACVFLVVPVKVTNKFLFSHNISNLYVFLPHFFFEFSKTSTSVSIK